MKNSIRKSILLFAIVSCLHSPSAFGQVTVTSTQKSSVKKFIDANADDKKINEIMSYKLADINIMSSNAINDNRNYYYQSVPELPMFLGVGFDPNDIEATKKSPFTYTVDTVEGTGSLNTTFNIDMVFNKEQLMKSLEIDAKLNVRYLTASVNASLNVAEKTEFSNDNLVVVLKGQTEYGRLMIKDLKLSADALNLYNNCIPVITYKRKKQITSCKSIFDTDAAAISEFQDEFGTKLPIVERRGAAIYLVCVIHNVSESTKKSVQASMNASASFLAGSASLSMSLKQEFESKMQKNEVDISILTKGGNGFQGIDKIITSLNTAGNSFDDVKLGFAEVLKQFNFGNAAPLGYFCVDINDLGLTNIPSQSDNDPVREKKLLDIVTQYRKNENLIFLINNILDYNNPAGYILSDPKREELSAAQSSLLFYQKELAAAHKCILRNADYSKCTIPSHTELDKYKLPEALDFTFATDIKTVGGAALPENINLNDATVVSSFSYTITTPFLKSVTIRVDKQTTPPTTEDIPIVFPKCAIDRNTALLTAGMKFESATLLRIESSFFTSVTPNFNPATAFQSGSFTPAEKASGFAKEFKLYMTVENLFGISKTVTIAYVLAYYDHGNFQTKFFYYPAKSN